MTTYFDEAYPDLAHRISAQVGTHYVFRDQRMAIGRMTPQGRWVLEGTYRNCGERRALRHLTSAVLRFNEVDIEQCYREGNVPFDATCIQAGADRDWHLVLVVPALLQQAARELQAGFDEPVGQVYRELVVRHEMNHARTAHLIGDDGTTGGNFRSELMADILLLQEVQSEPMRDLLLKLKQHDVRKIIAGSRVGYEYYMEYLKLIDALLGRSAQHDYPEILARLMQQLVTLRGESWESQRDALWAALDFVPA